MIRTGTVQRTTQETNIKVELTLHLHRNWLF